MIELLIKKLLTVNYVRHYIEITLVSQYLLRRSPISRLINMDMRFKEIERRLMADGWQLAGQRGSHCQYVHPTKPGRVTVPKHNGDVNPVTVRSIWRQAGIDERRTK